MKKALFCSLLLASSTAVAQQAESSNYNKSGWTLGFNAAVVSLDQDTARLEGIKDNAYLVGIVANYSQEQWITSLGVDVLVYDDNEEFKQTVVGDGVFNDGDISVESSSANGALVSVATGYQWFFGKQKDITLKLQGGYGHMFSSERSIANCSDCYEEDIDVKGGVFLKVGALKSNETFDIGIYAQQFLTGDGINNAIGLDATFSF